MRAFPRPVVPVGGESIFGIVSRAHWLGGRPSSRRMLATVFGCSTASASIGFPSRLSHCCDWLGWPQADVRRLIDQHTVLPYFRLATTEANLNRARDAMAGTQGGSVKGILGLLASRVGADNVLRYCIQCAQRDLEKVGIATWHRVHQLPGVLVCPEHGTPLLESTCLKHRRHWHELFLPQFAPTDFRPTLERAEADVLTKALHLASLNAELLLAPQLGRLTPSLRGVYRQWLALRGLLKGRDSIDQRPLIEAVRERWLPVIEASPELKLRFSSDPDFKWVIDLLRSRSRGRHPLKQSLVIGTLAPSVAAFANPPDRPPPPQPAPKPVAVPDWGDQLKELVINQGLSVSAAASKLGISVNTALVHAYRAGLPIVRRPKRLTPSDRREIAGRLAMNEPVRFIAHDVGLSESTINRILMEDRRIAAERDVASESARRDKARSALTAAVRQSPRPTFSAIRSTTGPDFAWLYRRDKKWLTEQLENARDTLAGEQRS